MFLERRRGAPSGAIYVRGREGGGEYLAPTRCPRVPALRRGTARPWPWDLDPSVSVDSTVHASFMMSSYHETEEMTAAEVAETLETLVRWSE